MALGSYSYYLLWKETYFPRRLFKNAPLGVPKLYLHYSLYYRFYKAWKIRLLPNTCLHTLALEIRALGGLIRNGFVERNLFSSGDFSKMHRLGYLSSISTIPYTTDLIKAWKSRLLPNTCVHTRYLEIRALGGLIRNMSCGKNTYFPPETFQRCTAWGT